MKDYKNLPLETRAQNACVKFLEQRDYNILNEDYNNWIICESDERDAFIFVKTIFIKDGEDFEKITPGEKKAIHQDFTKNMVKYFKENPNIPSDKTIVCDIVQILRVSSNRALIEHRLNAINID